MFLFFARLVATASACAYIDNEGKGPKLKAFAIPIVGLPGQDCYFSEREESSHENQ